MMGGTLGVSIPGASSTGRLTKHQLLAAAAILFALAASGWWLLRIQERSAMRAVLQSTAAIATPPVEIQFPARLNEAGGNLRSVLEPGAAAGYWTIQKTRPGPLILLTSKGQKYFSMVGGSIIAAFAAGTREITRVEGIEETGSTRKVRFRFVWTSLHPGVAVLGGQAPELGKPYIGEALLVRNGKAWSVAHWTTPELREGQEKFKRLVAHAAQ